MINMLKVLIGLFILVMIMAFALLGKKTLTFFRFRTAIGRKESEVILWIVTVAAIGVSIGEFIQNPTEPNAWKILGAYSFLMGAAFQIMAKKGLEEKTQEQAMKKNFHKATSYGIYHKLRHPSKTGLFFIVLGIAMTLGSRWGLAITLLLFIPALLFRTSQEEHALLDQYGDRYYDYQERTNKLIPFIL